MQAPYISVISPNHEKLLQIGGDLFILCGH